MPGRIRVGIGGWSFAPWRGVFYPKGTRQKAELNYASRQVTAIEINATYHGTQKPDNFAHWAAATPDGFVFSVKANRFCTNKRILAEAGDSIDRFLGQGIVELGDKLGPILWQFMPTKRFDPDDFAAFLALLPTEIGGLPLRHCVEARHESFATPEFAALCRRHDVAICLADHETYPLIDEATASFSYARLMRSSGAIETGYASADLDAWADRLKARAPGGDVFAFFIAGDKARNPAAAVALIERLG
jgi:uncharacterized protein YecE (DUF72 family)